jgi:hypothetical protein
MTFPKAPSNSQRTAPASAAVTEGTPQLPSEPASRPRATSTQRSPTAGMPGPNPNQSMALIRVPPRRTGTSYEALKNADTQRLTAHQEDRGPEAAPLRAVLPLGGSNLPARLIAAEASMRGAYDAVSLAGGLERCAPADRKRYQEALTRYLTEASATLRWHTLAPTRPLTPNLRLLGVNAAATLANNLVLFTAPTAIAAAIQPYTSPLANAAVFTGSLAALQTVAGELTTFLARKAGGAGIQARISSPNSGTIGPTKAVAANTLLVLMNVAIYAATHQILTVAKPLAETVGGNIGRQIGSGIAMSAVGSAITYAAAKNTMSRNGVSDARYLPERSNNRRLANGVYLNELPSWSQRTNAKNKTIEVLSATVGYLVANGALFALMGLATPKVSSAHGQSGINIAAGFTQLFAIVGLLGAAFTRFFNDPNYNANKFGIANKEVTIKNLRNSALTGVAELLDLAGNQLQDDRVSVTGPGALYRNALAVMSGQSSRRTTDDPKLADAGMRLEGELRALADIAMAIGSGGDLPSDAAQAGNFDNRWPMSGTLRWLKVTLEAAADCVSQLDAGATKPFLEVGLQPELNDLNTRIRDAMFLLAQCQYQLGESTADDAAQTPELQQMREAAQTHINALAAGILPLAAGARAADRIALGDAFSMLVSSMAGADSQRGKAATQTLTSGEVAVDVAGDDRARDALAALAHSNLLLGDIAERCRANVDLPQRDRFLTAADQLIRQAAKGETAEYLDAKLACLHNLVKAEPTDRQDVIDNVLAPLDTAARSKAHKRAVRDQLIEGLRSGNRFSLLEFRTAVRDLKEGADISYYLGDLESAVTPAENAQQLDAQAKFELLQEILGTVFLDAVMETAPGGATIDADKAASDTMHILVRKMMANFDTLPPTHRDPFLAAMSVSRPLDPPAVEGRLQNDAHHHDDNYNNRRNYLNHKTPWMNAQGIYKTMDMGIPSQIRDPIPTAKYYADARQKLYYLGKDLQLLIAWHTLAPERKARHLISMTDMDVTNGANIGKDMDQNMRCAILMAIGDAVSRRDVDMLRDLVVGGRWTRPIGGYKAVGEVTLIKEIVKDKNPIHPQIDSDATRILLREAAERGLPLVVHCDAGDPHDKGKYGDMFIDVVVDTLRKLQRVGGNYGDRLLQPGMLASQLPDRKLLLVWAHAFGIAKFTLPPNDHTLKMERYLQMPELQGVLKGDLSWDVAVGSAIQKNLLDLLVKRDISPPLQQAMTDVLKAYEAFQPHGSRADNAGDLGLRFLTSAHRVAAESAADLYMQSLENFHNVVARELAKDDVRAAFAEMMNNHGSDGNNWLYILNKYANINTRTDLFFGTDALAAGGKEHGDAAYAMNTRMLWPIYDLVEEMGRQFPEAGYDGISPAIRYEGFDRVFENEALHARRAASEEFLFNESMVDWAANVQPKPFTADTAVSRRLQRDDDARVDAAQIRNRRVVIAQPTQTVENFIEQLERRNPDLARDVRFHAFMLGESRGTSVTEQSGFISETEPSSASRPQEGLEVVVPSNTDDALSMMSGALPPLDSTSENRAPSAESTEWASAHTRLSSVPEPPTTPDLETMRQKLAELSDGTYVPGRDRRLVGDRPRPASDPGVSDTRVGRVREV